MSTLVLSDAHGYPELICNALQASGCGTGFGPERIVFAGDVVDRGDRPRECLKLLEGAGAEMLWGNHDVAVLLDRFVYPCSGESRGFRDEFTERYRSGAWRLATCVEGVLITHAGISADYAPLWEECGRDPERMATRLNSEFRAVVDYLLTSGRKDLHPPVLGNFGPLWFRPPNESRELLLQGAVQVVGHTPCRLPGVVAEVQQAGYYLVDPDVLGGLPPDERDRYRYALIEDGEVSVRVGKIPSA